MPIARKGRRFVTCSTGQRTAALQDASGKTKPPLSGSDCHPQKRSETHSRMRQSKHKEGARKDEAYEDESIKGEGTREEAYAMREQTRR